MVSVKCSSRFHPKKCLFRSSPVAIQEVGTVHVRVFPPGESATPDLVKVVTAVESATIFVYFSLETGPWPFRVENDSDFPFWLSQSVNTIYSSCAIATNIMPRTTRP